MRALKIHARSPSLSQDVVAESVDTPLEGTSEETAPVATAVESVETESTAAVVSGEGNGNNAPPDEASAAEAPGTEEKPAPPENEVPEIKQAPEVEQAVSDDAKPTAAAAATEDASNGNGNGAAVESNGDAGAAPEKEGEESGEIKTDQAAEPRKAEEAVKAGEEEMEVEAPPKEDLIVDYTDEFGRVRQMLQR